MLPEGREGDRAPPHQIGLPHLHRSTANLHPTTEEPQGPSTQMSQLQCSSSQLPVGKAQLTAPPHPDTMNKRDLHPTNDTTDDALPRDPPIQQPPMPRQLQVVVPQPQALALTCWTSNLCPGRNPT